MKTLQEKIAVMQAAADGKQIELWAGAGWMNVTTAEWNWASCDYRVKPEPRHVYAEVHVKGGHFAGGVFFPGSAIPMPPERTDCIWIKLGEVLK